ncbi:MAG: hypothetical protein V8Q45_12560 [Alistipes onderdonkii]
MHKTATLIAIMTLVCSCAPLRQTQTTSREQTETSDTTLTELIRREVESRFGTLRQTVVEFYPPAEVPLPLNLPDTLRDILPPPKIPVRQPIKRITYTEAAAQIDKTTATDSISRSRINTAARRDEQVQTEEKPSSGAVWLKWATALAGLLLLILLFIKLR